MYKFFFIFSNLKKENNKYKYLLKNIIFKLLFLFYAYKVNVNVPNNITLFDLVSKIILNKINIDWFMNVSEKLKKGKFEWNFNW